MRAACFKMFCYVIFPHLIQCTQETCSFCFRTIKVPIINVKVLNLWWQKNNFQDSSEHLCCLVRHNIRAFQSNFVQNGERISQNPAKQYSPIRIFSSERSDDFTCLIYEWAECSKHGGFHAFFQLPETWWDIASRAEIWHDFESI